MPANRFDKVAWMLFCCDNPPGKQEISGAQDAIGLVFPGLARSDYAGDYWPHHIEHVVAEETLRFVEQYLCLMPLGPREEGFAVLEDTHITPAGAKALADATAACWEAILAHDLRNFGASVRASFEAQIAMFPNMVTPGVRELIAAHSDRALGWKLSGAGGGGYVIFVAEQPLPESMRVVVRQRLE